MSTKTIARPATPPTTPPTTVGVGTDESSESPLLDDAPLTFEPAVAVFEAAALAVESKADVPVPEIKAEVDDSELVVSESIDDTGEYEVEKDVKKLVPTLEPSLVIKTGIRTAVVKTGTKGIPEEVMVGPVAIAETARSVEDVGIELIVPLEGPEGFATEVAKVSDPNPNEEFEDANEELREVVTPPKEDVREIVDAWLVSVLLYDGRVADWFVGRDESVDAWLATDQRALPNGEPEVSGRGTTVTEGADGFDVWDDPSPA